MKNKKAMAIVFLICLVLGILGHCKLLTANQENLKQKELENYLKTATLDPESRWKGVGGRTDAYFVYLDDGKIRRRGLLKFTDRTRPHHQPDSYKYGIAAYELDKLLNLNLVPPTVERKVEGHKASLMLCIMNPLREDERRVSKTEPPDPESFFNTMKDLNVFDNLTHSSSLCEYRGELDDILIEHKKDWKIWRVDLSQAFGPFAEMIQGCEITHCSKKLYQNLLKLDDKLIKSKLKKYLNKEEMKALLKRKKIIIETIKQLIKEKGEEAVLFS